MSFVGWRFGGCSSPAVAAAAGGLRISPCSISGAGRSWLAVDIFLSLG